MWANQLRMTRQEPGTAEGKFPKSFYLLHPSGEENNRGGKPWKATGRTFGLSHSSWPIRVFYCHSSQVVASGTWLLPKRVRSKVKLSFPLKKIQCCFFFLFFRCENVNRVLKTVTTAASTLVSLATARLQVASCISFCHPLVFTGSLQQLHPAFVTTKRTLIASQMLIPIKKHFRREVSKMDVWDIRRVLQTR